MTYLKLLETLIDNRASPWLAILAGLTVIFISVFKAVSATFLITRKDQEGINIKKQETKIEEERLALEGYQSLVKDLSSLTEQLKSRVEEQSQIIEELRNKSQRTDKELETLRRDVNNMKSQNKKQAEDLKISGKEIETYERKTEIYQNTVDYLIKLIRETGNKKQKQSLEKYLENSKMKEL
jgi:phenylalanyl-tRNA synthetase alpha subunit